MSFVHIMMLMQEQESQRQKSKSIYYQTNNNSSVLSQRQIDILDAHPKSLIAKWIVKLK